MSAIPHAENQAPSDEATFLAHRRSPSIWVRLRNFVQNLGYRTDHYDAWTGLMGGVCASV